MIDFNIEKINQRVNNANLHATPVNIADDMIELLVNTGFFDEPNNDMTAEDYVSSHRVLDIYCKSGSLLYSCYKKFMVALRHVIPDRDDRDYFIVRNLLYGVCPSISCINTLRDIFYNNKKYDLSHELGNFFLYDLEKEEGSDKDIVKELLKPMKFDVVVGNPPYNNDAYLDFVMLGHKLAKSYDLWITPAKFSFRTDYRNKCCFDNIKKSLSKIVYFTDCSDVFNIAEIGGVAYYLCDVNKESSNISVTSIASCNSYCNSIKEYDSVNNIKTLDIYADSIIDKVNNCNKFAFRNNVSDKYAVASSVMPAIGGGKQQGTYIFSKDGNLQFLAKYHFDTYANISSLSNNYRIMFSGSNSECKSFISYIDTRFIRFLLFIAKCSNSVMCTDVWRFVPDSGSFDHIFEDKPLDGYTPDENGIYTDKDGVVHCSLYIKYKLTQQEIDVIESVIRERK